MKILLLLTDAFGGEGGIAQFNRDFLTALSRYSEDLEIVAIPRKVGPSFDASALPRGLRYLREGAEGKIAFIRVLLGVLFKERKEFHAVICGHLNLLPLACLAKGMTGKPLVQITHGWEAWRPFRGPLHEHFLRSMDVFVSVSEVTRRRFMAGYSGKTIPQYVIPNTVDLDRFTPGPKNPELINRYGLEGKKVLLTVGRLESKERSKGFDETLDLLPELIREIPNLVYLIVGDGSDRARLEAKARELGMSDKTIFAGFAPEKDKPDYYRLADLFVMPGQKEGFGIVYLEAMACGIPAIGSKLDGSREALGEGELGAVIDPRSRVELKSAILAGLSKSKGVPPGLNRFSFPRFEERCRNLLSDVLRPKPYRLAVLNTHPIQYFAPLYRRMSELPDIDLTVFYCSRQGAEARIDPGFQKSFAWDVPLLEGYRYKFLRNWRGEGRIDGFFDLINPGIIGELRKGRYDALLVHGHDVMTNLLGILAAKLSGTAVFMRTETHLLLKRSSLKSTVRRGFVDVMGRLCDAFLCVGTRNKEFYARHGVPSAKLFLAPYAVDNELFTRTNGNGKERPEGDFIPAHLPIILFVGKFIPRKRPADLITAYANLRRRGVSAALVMLGEGPLRGELERYAATHSVPDVHFIGFKNQTRLPTWYRSASVLAVPSEDEPWGLVINEAMCCGVPVITTEEVGAAADLVQDGVTGYLYPCGNVSELEKRLNTVISDARLRDTLSGNCIERMRTWSYREFITGIREALQKTAK